MFFCSLGSPGSPGSPSNFSSFTPFADFDLINPELLDISNFSKQTEYTLVKDKGKKYI